MTTATRSPKKPSPPARRPAVKSIDDPLRFLLDEGYLFYFNLRSLHPVGLSLTVREDPDTGMIVIDKLIDKRDRPDHEFSQQDYATGQRKLFKSLAAWGNTVTKLRRQIKGWATQPFSKSE